MSADNRTPDERKPQQRTRRKPNGPAVLVRLSPELHDRLMRFCRSTDRVMAATARRAICEFLDREDANHG